PTPEKCGDRQTDMRAQSGRMARARGIHSCVSRPHSRPGDRGRDAAGSLHCSANGWANGNARWIEAVETGNVDTKIIGRDALAMEGIDAARLAEEMACGHGVESVFGEGVFAGQEFEPIFMNLDHQRIPATADRAIAGGQFWEVTLNLEFNGTAMA